MFSLACYGEFTAMYAAEAEAGVDMGHYCVGLSTGICARSISTFRCVRDVSLTLVLFYAVPCHTMPCHDTV